MALCGCKGDIHGTQSQGLHPEKAPAPGALPQSLSLPRTPTCPWALLITHQRSQPPVPGVAGEAGTQDGIQHS